MIVPQLLLLALLGGEFAYTLSSALFPPLPQAALSGVRQTQMAELLVLGTACLLIAAGIAIMATLAFATPRTVVRLGPDGIVATFDYRPDFWVPWDAGSLRPACGS